MQAGGRASNTASVTAGFLVVATAMVDVAKVVFGGSGGRCCCVRSMSQGSRCITLGEGKGTPCCGAVSSQKTHCLLGATPFPDVCSHKPIYGTALQITALELANGQQCCLH